MFEGRLKGRSARRTRGSLREDILPLQVKRLTLPRMLGAVQFSHPPGLVAHKAFAEAAFGVLQGICHLLLHAFTFLIRDCFHFTGLLHKCMPPIGRG